ncbi:MAG: SDR family NAD(P)-dependent oxidoreductase [Pseudomonadota bacterium]
MTTWVVIGASSAMGTAFARKVAREGHSLIVTTRKLEEAKALCADLHIRGASTAEPARLDLTDHQSIAALSAQVMATSQDISVAFFAGSMRPQEEISAEPELGAQTYQDNLVGPAECLLTLAAILEQRGSGVIIALSSVAGDRGRASNYVYGSAKAGFTAFLSGLRNRLSPFGIRVVTVKAGFVDTEMTWGLPGMFLVADPIDVANALWKASARGPEVIYLPKFWWVIMTIIRTIPEPIFKKLKL